MRTILTYFIILFLVCYLIYLSPVKMLFLTLSIGCGYAGLKFFYQAADKRRLNQRLKNLKLVNLDLLDQLPMNQDVYFRGNVHREVDTIQPTLTTKDCVYCSTHLYKKERLKGRSPIFFIYTWNFLAEHERHISSCMLVDSKGKIKVSFDNTQVSLDQEIVKTLSYDTLSETQLDVITQYYQYRQTRPVHFAWESSIQKLESPPSIYISTQIKVCERFIRPHDSVYVFGQLQRDEKGQLIIVGTHENPTLIESTPISPFQKKRSAIKYFIIGLIFLCLSGASAFLTFFLFFVI